MSGVGSRSWWGPLGILLWLVWGIGGCSSPAAYSCSEDEECFANEECRGGVCEVVEPEGDGESDVDCVRQIGICGDGYCHPELRECVECVRNDHCPGVLICNRESNQCTCPEGTHECEGVCVDSSSPQHCGSRCEPCGREWGSDPVCREGRCELECAEGFFPCAGEECETECIQCVSHGDCTSPDRSRCYEGRCQGCATSQDCAGKPETPVCDQSTGTCIECTVTESAACQGMSCNPATNRCTTTPVRSLSDCEQCLADAECQDSQRCVPMFFAGQARPGGYCLDVEALTTCRKPYPIHLERVSLSGYPLSRYCGIREEKITCEAFKDFSRPCAHNNECGAEGLDDGNCTWFSGGGNPRYRCTHACSDDEDCMPGAWCTNPNSGFCLDTSGQYDD